MSDYSIKWKGQTTGPYTLDELRKKYEDREIGGMHEVFYEGRWITIRAFFLNIHRVGLAGGAPVVPSALRAPDIVPAILVNPKGLTQIPVAVTTTNFDLSQTRDLIPDTRDRLVYAGFWVRAAASVIDLMILLGVPFLVYDIFIQPGLIELERIQKLPLSSLGLVTIVFGGVSFFYFTLFESSSRGATPGKRLLGLRVVTELGYQICFPTAAWRFVWMLVGLAPGFAGIYLAAFSPRKQALHDNLTKTLVCFSIPSSRFLH